MIILLGILGAFAGAASYCSGGQVSENAICQENPDGPTGAAARLRCRAEPHPALAKMQYAPAGVSPSWNDVRLAGWGPSPTSESYSDADAVLAFVSLK